MIPIPVPDKRRIKELEDEIELLRGSIPLDKAYFQQKYQLQIKRRGQEFRDVIQHLIVYVICNSVLVGINAFSGGGFPWSIFPIILWGMGLGLHYATFVRKYDYSLNRYSKRLTLELMKQFKQSQESPQQ